MNRKYYMKPFLLFSCFGIALTLSSCATVPSSNSTNSMGEQLTSLTAKYLPGYTLRAEDRGGSSPTYLLVAPGGDAVRGVPGWQELKGVTVAHGDGDVYMGSPALNALFRERRIRITSRAQALEIAHLITGLAGMGMFTEHKHWKNRVKRFQGGWLLTTEYVGPPAMIRDHGSCELLVGPDKQFIELGELQPL